MAESMKNTYRLKKTEDDGCVFDIIKNNKKIGFCSINRRTGRSRVWIKKEMPNTYFERYVKSTKDLLEEIASQINTHKLYEKIFGEPIPDVKHELK